MKRLIAATMLLMLGLGGAALAEMRGPTGTPPYNPMAPAPGPASTLGPGLDHDTPARPSTGAGLSADCPGGGVPNQPAANPSNTACAAGSGVARPSPGNTAPR